MRKKKIFALSMLLILLLPLTTFADVLTGVANWKYKGLKKNLKLSSMQLYSSWKYDASGQDVYIVGSYKGLNDTSSTSALRSNHIFLLQVSAISTKYKKIYYKIDKSASKYRNLIETSAKKWNKYGSVIEKSDKKHPATLTVRYKNGVLANNPWVAGYCQIDRPNKKATIALNSSGLSETCIVHEFGHGLGLEHQNTYDSVMSYRYSMNAPGAIDFQSMMLSMERVGRKFGRKQIVTVQIPTLSEGLVEQRLLVPRGKKTTIAASALPNITGYTRKSVTVGKLYKNTTKRVNYERKTYTTTIDYTYYDATGKRVQKRWKTLSKKFMDKLSVKATDFPATKGNTRVGLEKMTVYGKNKQIVNFRRNEYKVTFVAKSRGVLLEPLDNDTALYGEKVSFTSNYKKYGYHLVGAKTLNFNVTGNTTKSFEYEPDVFTITNRMVDEETGEVLKEERVQAEYDSKYSFTPVVEGYDFGHSDQTLPIKVDGNQTITYYMRKR